MRQIRIGEMSGGKTRRLERVESIWQKAGFQQKLLVIFINSFGKSLSAMSCVVPRQQFLNAILESCSKIWSSRSRTWMYDGGL